MRASFKLRPLTLDVETSGKPRPQIVPPARLLFRLYRAAERRVVGELLAENRRLRHGQPPTLTTMLARAFDQWLRRRYPPPPPERSYD